MKTCQACKQELPLSAFHSNYDKRRGRHYPRSECKECGKARRRGYAAKNRDKEGEWNRLSYQRRRDEKLAYQKLYYIENKEDRSRWFREVYYPANRAQIVMNANAYRARRASAPGILTPADIEVKFVFQGGLCYYCGCDISGGFEADHKIPLSKGGTNWPANIALACRSCNRGKRDKDLADFLP